MGLDKRKPILLRKDFDIDPLMPKNALLSNDNKSSLPTLVQDAQIDNGQSNFYSFQHVLGKLLANDKFIDIYLQKAKN